MQAAKSFQLFSHLNTSVILTKFKSVHIFLQLLNPLIKRDAKTFY